jgi:hypothetical protein
VLLQAWRKLPHVDPNALQADLDAALDPCL